jgi:hypothetical protein
MTLIIVFPVNRQHVWKGGHVGESPSSPSFSTFDNSEIHIFNDHWFPLCLKIRLRYIGSFLRS